MAKFDSNNEWLFISDGNSWVWTYVLQALETHKLPFIHMTSENSLRKSWSRIQNAPKIILHWESRFRQGGTIIEEILSLDPLFDFEQRLIVISSDPTPDDEVYFEELLLHNVIVMRNNLFDIRKSIKELNSRIENNIPDECKRVRLWRKALRTINNLKPDTPKAPQQKIIDYITKLGQLDQQPSNRFEHAQALMQSRLGNKEEAMKIWEGILARNPHHPPARDGIIELYCQSGNYQRAMDLLKQLLVRNKNNIKRIVKLGELHRKLNDHPKAEHYFQSALSKDPYCSPALNGLASLRFAQGDLEASRKFLAQSTEAYEIASQLNQVGIELVRKEQYAKALDLYTKAHYVLPDQDKGPMIFYNIGLCYSRWGKKQEAKQFLQLALIKEPTYEKARQLMSRLDA